MNTQNQDLPLNVEGPYRHGQKFRCRLRTPEGRKWMPSADTIEGAIEEARKAAQEPPPPEEGPGVPPTAGPETREPAPHGGPRDRSTGPGPSGVRILGPYEHEGGWRCRLVTSAGRSWAPTAPTEAAAVRYAERRAAEQASLGAITVRDAVDAFLRGKEVAGAQLSTLDGMRRGLTTFLGTSLDGPVSRLTPRRCQDLYDALQIWVGPRGHTLAIATHRSYLLMARSWGRWVVAKGWLKGTSSPLDGVKGGGRKNRGKLQLSLDEARKLYGVGLDLARQGDEGAVAVLMCISMGMRASEVLSRTPRDLDNEGTLLRVCDNALLGFKCKNDSSKRPVAVPTDLQPILAQMCRDKLPTAPLFPASTKTGRRRRQWLHSQAKRLSVLAKVTVVCPHGLRGVSATAAAAAGALPELVAKMLGHTTPEMTKQHYIKPGVSEAAQLERGVQILTKKA